LKAGIEQRHACCLSDRCCGDGTETDGCDGKAVGCDAAGVKTIRPPLEAFYATLSDEQKARLDGRMRFWRELW
jgi:hypothetical protein